MAGKLVDKNGAPVYGAGVRYVHLDDKTEGTGLAWSWTDRDGRFIIHGIPVGEINLKTRKDSKLISPDLDQQKPITITEGEINEIGIIQAQAD